MGSTAYVSVKPKTRRKITGSRVGLERRVRLPSTGANSSKHAHGDRGRPRAPSQWEIINRARVSQNFGGADDVQGFASSSPFTHRRALQFATHASSRRGALFVKVHPPTRRAAADPIDRGG